MAIPNTTTVGIAGISGKFGRLLARALLNTYPSVHIRGYCRSSNLPSWLTSSPRVTIIQGSATDLARNREFVRGCDVVVCVYLNLSQPGFMFESQAVIVDACEEEGVPRFVAADMTFDYTKLPMGEMPLKDEMLKVKAYVEGKRNVKGVHILCGTLMETYFAKHTGLFDVEVDGTPVLKHYREAEDEIRECTTYGDAAKFTAAVCMDPKAVGVLRFLGGRATVVEMADMCERVFGVKAKLLREDTMEGVHEKMWRIQSEAPKDVMSWGFLMFRYFISDHRCYTGPNLDNDKYPIVKPLDFESFMKQFGSAQEMMDGWFAVGKNVNKG